MPTRGRPGDGRARGVLQSLYAGDGQDIPDIDLAPDDLNGAVPAQAKK